MMSGDNRDPFLALLCGIVIGALVTTGIAVAVCF
jgi:hypothetical protein